MRPARASAVFPSRLRDWTQLSVFHFRKRLLMSAAETWQPPARAKPGFYSSIENQKLFFDWAGKKLSILHRDSWYRIPTQRLCDLGGEPLMKKHSYSMHRAMSTVYPDHEWLPWLFVPISSGLWNSAQVQRRFISWLEPKINVNALEDWYSIQLDVLKPFGGAPRPDSAARALSHFLRLADRMLHTQYGGSLPRMLVSIYPKHAWKPWLFVRVAPNFWADPGRERAFLDWYFQQASFSSMSDWYSVSVQAVRDKGGSTLLRKHNDSLVSVLFYTYPEHHWDLLKFSKLPQHFWTTSKRRRLLFDWLGRELGIVDPADWYAVTSETVEKLGLQHALKMGVLGGKYGSVAEELGAVYPEHPWEKWRFRLPGSSPM